MIMLRGRETKIDLREWENNNKRVILFNWLIKKFFQGVFDNPI